MMPSVPPMLSPKEREMMKYSPPPSTRLLVASSEMASAVGMVTMLPTMIRMKTPHSPTVPTAYPKRRKRMAPKRVAMAVK